MAVPTSTSTTTNAEGVPSSVPDGDEPAPQRYRNRELSWLDFNARVLALAEDDRIPLLERAKFLAIFGQNLDEFFQVRVAGLKDQVAAGIGGSSPDGRTSAQQLLDIRDRLDELLPRMQATFLDRLTPALAEAGIRLSSWAELDDEDEKFLVETFEERIFPVLTPLAVDPGHPFPYISNLSLNLAVIVRDPDADVRRFARVKVPSLLPRFVVLPDGERYVPLEQVMAAHLDQLFPGMEIEQHHAFRVTRNTDLTLEEEEADDLLAMVEVELRRRRFGRAVRLEIDAAMSDEVRELLQRELDVADEDVYVHTAPLDLGGLWSVHALDRHDLKDPPYQRVTPPRLASTDGERVDFFAAIRKGDLLVHHPYESFRTTVEEFVRQAANDPRVLAIKMTLYRTSGDSPIARSLIRAAERGKQVAVIVELKARFDEGANIEWARQLETAGVHVTYGLIGLKVHSKATLVVREEADGLRRYCHVGTGNYNSKTARVYEDMGLLTCDPAIGDDMSQLFNELTGYGRNIDYQRLLVAPRLMRDGLNDLIQGEIDAGPGVGRITMKMNSLVDQGMIEELYRASQAGVEIDLIVRGICCLTPGVPGMSESIRVRSLVGRYLEHSRIYRFANGLGEGHQLHLIGSADLMPRNLDRRVEVLTPVSDVALQARLDEVLDVELRDDVLAWSLGPDGRWTHAPPGGETESHVELQRRTVARAAQAVSASVV
ncbi:MAG TPA: RNA degradosome polyphosphate kinase [Acidimicrobiales bacterium]|nr:RNA degradosome polyphosphate kinase [Acidimicrobiales bacterium]